MKRILATLATLLTLSTASAAVQTQPAPAPTQTLSELAQSVGLQPSDYARLVAALGEGAAKAVIRLQAEFGLDKAQFRSEFRGIAEALIDMVQAGLAKDAAMSTLRSAIAANPRLDEVSTIVADKLDLKEAGVSPELIRAFLALHNDLTTLGISPETFLQEHSTLAAALIDMIEAGIGEALAFAVLKEAMRADPSLEEVTTITARVIDLREEGMAVLEALATAKREVLNDRNDTHGQDDDDQDAPNNNDSHNDSEGHND
jgi:hypothetical protein